MHYMYSATRWYGWLTFLPGSSCVVGGPMPRTSIIGVCFVIMQNSVVVLVICMWPTAFTISDQNLLSSVACPIRAAETQRLAGRCWSSCRPQLRELHWAFVPASAWLCRPAGRWHQAAGASPNYNYQLQLQMETSRRDGPCILCGLHQPPQSALKSLNRPAARTNHHTLHQLLKCLWASCRLNTV